MLELQGIPVSPGVAIGPALVLDSDGYQIPRTIVAAEEAAGEYVRLREAVDAVSTRLEASRLETAAVAGEDTGDIFAAQLQMLHDPRLHAELARRIRHENQSAGYSVNRVLHNYAAALRRLDNPLLADRAEDVLDIEKQLLFELGAMTRQPLSDLSEPVIVLAHNLTPSETANSGPSLRARVSAPRSADRGDTPPSSPRGWNCPPSSASDRSLTPSQSRVG